MSSDPQYPDVVVNLSGEDGNIFFIGARVGKALRNAGYADGAARFYAELQQQPDYNAALRLVMRTVTVR